MNNPKSVIQVNIDPANPGQFFACCGLLELADRFWAGAEGWFEERRFLISSGVGLAELIRSAAHASLIQLDENDNTASPMELILECGSIRLDWWLDDRAGGKELKVWAGTMESVRIARAMQFALRNERFHDPDLFNLGMVAYDPDNPAKKVEPFYFDARRSPNAHSRDVGFSPNDLQFTTTAFPAVEFFCLVGLQRSLPIKTDLPRIFEYRTWSKPYPPAVIPALVCGLLQVTQQNGYRFENWYRTGQKKHKAFRTAIPMFSERR